MTVSELLDLLRALPQDFDVGVPNRNGKFTEPIVEIDDLGTKKVSDKVIIIRSGHIYSDADSYIED